MKVKKRLWNLTIVSVLVATIMMSVVITAFATEGNAGDLSVSVTSSNDYSIEELTDMARELKRTIVATSSNRVPMGSHWVTQQEMTAFQNAVAPFMPATTLFAATSFNEVVYTYEPLGYAPDPVTEAIGPNVEDASDLEYADMQSAYVSAEQSALNLSADEINVFAGHIAAFEAVRSSRLGTLQVDDAFSTNVQLFPELWCAETLRTAPAFQWTAGNTHDLVGTTWTPRDDGGANDFNIVEEVFIELPLDTDGDGRRDMIRATIRRPIESERYEDLKIPAFLETSPYREGTLGLTVVDVTVPMFTTPDTSALTYDDVRSLLPRAADWPWDRAGAIWWDTEAEQWRDGEQPPSLNLGVIPAAVAAVPAENVVTRGTPVPVGGGGGHTNHGGGFASYMFVRGYAVITTNSVGTTLADGFTSTGGICETLSAMAAIQWLNGEARGFTCQNALYEVDATTWSNGMVAMSGGSYNGTLPIAAAAAGTQGLGLIIPQVAISNWYYYHRANGLVHYPGRNNAWHAGFPGEEASDLALICFTRRSVSGVHVTNAIQRNIRSYLDFHGDTDLGRLLRANADIHWANMIEGEDLASGNYNRFWDERNYLATASEITAGIIMQHALNDFNVMPRHFDVLWRAVQEQSDAEMRLVLNRSGHSGFHTHDAVFDWQHLWFDHFLNGVENNALDMPAVQIQSSVTGLYESFDSWPIPDSEYRRYFLAPSSDGSASYAGFLTEAPPAVREFDIRDTSGIATAAGSWNSTLVPAVGSQYVNAAFRNRLGGAGEQGPNRPQLLANWERAMFNVNDLDAHSTDRIVFVTEITENVRMSGTVVASIEAASDEEFGIISAALVEIRPPSRGRAFGAAPTGAGAAASTRLVRNIPAQNGAPAINVVTTVAPINPSGNNFWIDYKKITSGHASIQNPNQTDIVSYVEFPDTIPVGMSRGRTYMEAGHQSYIPNYYFQSIVPTPGEFNTYVFSFEVMDWEFQAGDKVAIMVFTSDYRHTMTPSNPPTITVRTGESTFVDIPSLTPFNTVAPPVEFSGTNPSALGQLLLEGDVVLSTRSNLGIFEHQSPFVVPEGSTLYVQSTLNVQRNARLVIEGTVVVLDGGRINNQGNSTSGGTIEITVGGRLVNNGHVENVSNSNVLNNGTIVNNARFEVRAGTTFANRGDVEGGNRLNIHRDARIES